MVAYHTAHHRNGKPGQHFRCDNAIENPGTRRVDINDGKMRLHRGNIGRFIFMGEITFQDLMLLSDNEKAVGFVYCVINDFTTLLKCVVEIKELADENNEYKTSALMDSFIESYSKKLWMLKQMME